MYLFSSVAWYLFCHFAHGTEAMGGATYSSPLLTKSQSKYTNRRTPTEWELITQTDNSIVQWEPYKNTQHVTYVTFFTQRMTTHFKSFYIPELAWISCHNVNRVHGGIVPLDSFLRSIC
jgi:hypothetical protein